MRLICTSIVATFVLAGTSFANTIDVCPSGCTYSSIQDAINASVNGDVIAIAAGTYYEFNLDTDGKAITIGSASGNLDVTIDAQQGGRVFVIQSGESGDTVIKDLVITGGQTNYGGGGILCDYNSSPTISGCTISGNTSDEGGGILCYDNNPTISGCTIEGNTAEYAGGGILCVDSNPTISGCTIEGNMTSNDYGGGIYCNENSNATISGCTIKDNTANDGGGIACSNSDPFISDCTIEGNTAEHAGGGILCVDSNPTISSCTIKDNTADDGGGIYCVENSNATISGCTIKDNTADDGGGGIYCDHRSNPTISDSQICGNEPNQIYGSYADAGGNTVAEECPIPEGACCVGSSCSVLTEDDCVVMGGTYQGDNSDCSGDPCYTPPTKAACCVTSGCDVMAEAMCENLGGTWLVEGGSCDDCAPTCQGDANADGVVDVLDLLKVIDGWGICD